jgi:hypothetical protein
MKNKSKKFTDEATGKGTIKRPTNPADLFRKAKKNKKKMTQAQDDAYDRKHGNKEGSKADIKQDRMNGIMDKKKKNKAKVVRSQTIAHKAKAKAVKMTGKFGGKSNRLGQGGRAAQLRAQGVPGGVIGNLARAAHAAPGQANYRKAKEAKKKAYMKRVGK